MGEFTRGLNIRLGLLFSKLGISPNSWTLISLVPALIGFVVLSKGNLLAGLLCFVLTDLLDAIDGAVARVTSSVSNLGAFLDGIIERYLEVLFYLGLLLYLRNSETFLLPNHIWILFLIYGALMIPFVSAYADHKKVAIKTDEKRRLDGILGRNSRIVFLYVCMLAGVFNTNYLIYCTAAAAVVVNVAALQRIAYIAIKK